MSVSYEITDEGSWREAVTENLDSFEAVWPVYERRGFSRETALLAFHLMLAMDSLHEVTVAIDDLADSIPADPDDDAPWKGGPDP